MSVRPNAIACLVGALATVGVAAGCSSPATDDASTNSSLTVPSSGVPQTSTVPAPPPAGAVNLSDQAKQQLCTDLEIPLSDWRVQGPTLGRPGLLILVNQWALGAGGPGLNLQIANDRSIVDTITTETCPDIRRQAIEALNLPDLASGLIGR
jgi:hypothetical protein